MKLVCDHSHVRLAVKIAMSLRKKMPSLRRIDAGDAEWLSLAGLYRALKKAACTPFKLASLIWWEVRLAMQNWVRRHKAKRRVDAITQSWLESEGRHGQMAWEDAICRYPSSDARERWKEVFSLELDGRERLVMEWTYFDGLSYSEVGDRLGIGKSTARQLHDRAKGKLRDALTGGRRVA